MAKQDLTVGPRGLLIEGEGGADALFRVGSIVPIHNAPEGSRYFRTTPAEEYKQDGPGETNNWVLVSSGGIEKKAGVVDGTTFSTVSSKKVYDVTFSTAFSDANYAINIDGEDQRIWTWTNKVASGFRISSQSNSALLGYVSWSAIKNGED